MSRSTFQLLLASVVVLSGCGLWTGARPVVSTDQGPVVPPQQQVEAGPEPSMVPALVEPLEPIASIPSIESVEPADRLRTLVGAQQEHEIALEVRVGLDSDLAEVAMVAPAGGMVVWGPELHFEVGAGQVVKARATVGSADPGSLRVQVAALRDVRQAEGLAARQRAKTGWPADAAFDAATGFYRVRVGRFADRATAEVARRRLVELGAPDAWIGTEAGSVHDPAIVFESGGKTWRAAGRDAVIETRGEPMRWRDARFRGHLRLFVNDRGSLNVVNEVDLESYLRGVVTREMGPGVYPWPAALAAQTIAARTYTLRHLGEFAAEGFDICATPRCQVYRGLDDEHPLADAAVVATRSVVLLDGSAPADALYSASCGGHTENVDKVFTTLRASYLRGLPCVEAGSSELGGGAGEPFAHIAKLLAPGSSATSTQLVARFEAVATRRGLGAGMAQLPNLGEAALRAYVSSRFDLVLDPQLATGMVATNGHELPPKEQRLARALADLDEPITDRTLDRLLIGLGEALDLVSPTRGRFLGVRDGRLRLGVGTQEQVVRLARSVAFGRGSDLEVAGAATSLALAPGDPVVVWRLAGEVVAVLAEPGSAPSQRKVPLHGPWRKFKSRAELVRRAALEYPGLELVGLQVLDRGVSSRVARLQLLGRNGERELVEGLAIRWLLDIPDTRFEIEPAESGGAAGWTFRGRGWGHGVGMCQTGAALMARSGRSAEEILQHYYSGLELGVVRQVERVATWEHDRP